MKLVDKVILCIATVVLFVCNVLSTIYAENAYVSGLSTIFAWIMMIIIVGTIIQVVCDKWENRIMDDGDQ
jgi:amino acid permease